MDAKQVKKILSNDGWFPTSQRGSHQYFKHSTKKGKVTVPSHSKKDIDIKTLNSIWKQAGLK